MPMALLSGLGLLAACNSSQDVLDPRPVPQAEVAAAVPPPSSGLPATGPQSPTPSPAATHPLATISSTASPERIEFAPIVGTSVEAATALNRELSARAKDHRIQLVGTGGSAATHLLKGYFTPLKEGSQTTVIYVWDVYDPGGNRVHRISGQQKAASTPGEGWASVSPTIMQAIADTTIDQIAAWLAGRTG